MFLIPPDGIVSKIEGINDTKNLHGIIEVTLNFKPGDLINIQNNNLDRRGYIIAIADSSNAAEERAFEALKFIKVT